MSCFLFSPKDSHVHLILSWRWGECALWEPAGLWNTALWPSPFGGECSLHCFLNYSQADGGDPDWWYRYVSAGQAPFECLDSAYTRRGGDGGDGVA